MANAWTAEKKGTIGKEITFLEGEEVHALNVYREETPISAESWHMWLECCKKAKEIVQKFHKKATQSTEVPAFIMQCLEERLAWYGINIREISVRSSGFSHNEDFYIEPPEISFAQKEILTKNKKKQKVYIIPDKITKPFSIILNKKICAMDKGHKGVIERHTIIPCVHRIVAGHHVEQLVMSHFIRCHGEFKKNDDILRLWDYYQDVSARLAYACYNPDHRKLLLADYRCVARKMGNKTCGAEGCAGKGCLYVIRNSLLATRYEEKFDEIKRGIYPRKYPNDRHVGEIINVKGGTTVRLYANQLRSVIKNDESESPINTNKRLIKRRTDNKIYT